MTREEFMNLDIDKKVEYINQKLSEGKTVTIIREDLEIGKKYLQKELKNGGYKYNQKNRMYVKEPINSIAYKEPINSIQDANSMQNSLPMNFKEDIIEILDMKEDLKEVIRIVKEGYAKEPTQVIEIVEDKGIKISLPQDEVVRTTVRANKRILNMWNEFCSSNNEYSKQDLISMAMKEYIEKYEKK